MGMFDEIKCSYPIPKGQGNVFQTKSLNNVMARYEIAKGGVLFLIAEDWMIKELDKPEMVKYTGEIRFYGYEDDETEDWLEYSAYFIDGKLKHMVEL